MRTAGLALAITTAYLILQILLIQINTESHQVCIGGQIMTEGTTTTFEMVCHEK